MDETDLTTDEKITIFDDIETVIKPGKGYEDPVTKDEMTKHHFDPIRGIGPF